MKTLLHLMLSLTMAISVMACTDDSNSELYTVPSVVTLGAPIIDAKQATASLTAVYDGDDGAIEEAAFVMENTAQGTAVVIGTQSWSDGKATATVSGLQPGNEYQFNFIITTKGNNTIKAEEYGLCSFVVPAKVNFSVTSTTTAKILEAAYNGCDQMIQNASFEIKNSSGQVMSQVPTPVCGNGKARILLLRDQWEEDIYSCIFKMALYDGTEVVSSVYKLSMMPLPENIILSAPVIEGNTFHFSATYDGEDKTIEAAHFILYDKNGVQLEEVEATCVDRMATAVIEGYAYAKYSCNCVLDLVDGSVLRAPEAMLFTHAKPRTFEKLVLDPVAMGASGMNTSSTEGVCMVTYLDKIFEYENMYARTSSGKTTLYTKSALLGYMQNNTPFAMGIKAVYINNSSGKELVNFACYGKKNEEDSWTEITSASKVGNQFIYDFSGDNFYYFKYATKATSELKATNFEVEYYTEPYVEY